MTLHEAASRVQGALRDSRRAQGAIHELLDEWEREQTISKLDAYDVLSSFLPVEEGPDADATYDAIAENLDGFVGWCHENYARWPHEPHVGDRNVPRAVVGVWDGRAPDGTLIARLPGPPTYFVGRRAPGLSEGGEGKWEFPGGKREQTSTSSETNEGCLCREWQEEFGWPVTVGERLYTGRHGGDLLVIAFGVRVELGIPYQNRVHSETRWMTRTEILALPDDEVMPALKSIARELTP